VTRVIFTRLAQADLEAIGDYIALDNPRRALSFIEELRDHCKKIASSPLAYRPRQELAEGLRSCAHGRYVIFFQARDDVLLIVRILHGAQDIQAQFRE
jgi:toxin ParE1/3/4